MNKNEVIDLEALLVDKLRGRITLLQPQTEKEEVIHDILSSATGGEDKEKIKNDYPTLPVLTDGLVKAMLETIDAH